jgi:hypothetical protein
MITWIKRLFLTAGFLALIAANVLTLTHTAFNAALSGLMGTAFGIQTVSDVLRNKVDAKNRTIKKHTAASVKRKAATRRFGARLTSRTKRVAAESIAAIPAEAIPFLGISILIAGTSYELYEACQSIKDLDQMYADMGMTDETPDDVMHSVCDPQVPEPGKVWSGVVDQVDQWWEKFVAAV